MTLDHFGRPISYYLYQCFGFFSAAEGFFFLSGFVGMIAATSKAAKDPGQGWMRRRAVRIWVYHALTMAVLSVLALLCIPKLVPYFDALYEHPLLASFWGALLVYTPMWLDVLPLYVIFLLVGSFVFPLFVKAKNARTVAFLWLPSLALWFAAQFGLRDVVNSLFPAWVHHGSFDPFGWQFAYFTGAATYAWWNRVKAGGAARVVNALTPLLLAVLVFCFLWSHEFIGIPLPSDFWVSKDHLGFFRFFNFYAFMLLICWVVRVRQGLLDFRPLNTVGRHSLDVYTAHIVLIYMWFTVVPSSIRYHLPWSVVLPLLACVLLWGLAKLREPKPRVQ